MNNRIRIAVVVAAAMVATVAFATAAVAKGKVKPKPVTSTFNIVDLDADTEASDVKKLQTTVKAVKGVVSVVASPADSMLTVKHGKKVTREALEAAIEKAGFTVVAPDSDDDEPSEYDSGDMD